MSRSLCTFYIKSNFIDSIPEPRCTMYFQDELYTSLVWISVDRYLYPCLKILEYEFIDYP